MVFECLEAGALDLLAGPVLASDCQCLVRKCWSEKSACSAVTRVATQETEERSSPTDKAAVATQQGSGLSRRVGGSRVWEDVRTAWGGEGPRPLASLPSGSAKSASPHLFGILWRQAEWYRSSPVTFFRWCCRCSRLIASHHGAYMPSLGSHRARFIGALVLWRTWEMHGKTADSGSCPARRYEATLVLAVRSRGVLD